MRTAAWIALSVIVLASLSCNLVGISPNIPKITPTEYPIQITPQVTQPVVKSSTPSAPTQVPTQEPTTIPAITATASPTTSIPVLILAERMDPNTTTGTFQVVDSSNGNTLKSFSVNGISPHSSIMAASDYVFYVDGTTNMIRRTGADGSNIEMPFTNNTEKPFMGIYLPSPDGQRIAWANTDLLQDGKWQVELTAANVDGTNLKILVDERRENPSRAEPVAWSRDGKFLYFTNAMYGIGGYILFYGWADLQKVNLETGTITEILPDSHCLCAGAVSPDEKKVAYLTRPEADNLELNVMDIATSEKAKYELSMDHRQAGSISWAPDSSALVITVARGNPDNEASTILKIDLATKTIATIIPDDIHVYRSLIWPVHQIIWVEDADGHPSRLNVATGSLINADPERQVLLSDHR